MKSFFNRDASFYDTELKITDEESNRINVLKVWLVIMVIFIHSVKNNVEFVGESVILDVPVWMDIMKTGLCFIIFICCVPGFFFLSSYFLYRKPFSWTQNVKKKMISLMVPYLILNTFWVLVYLAGSNIPAVSGFFSNQENYVLNWDIGMWLRKYFGSPYWKYPLLYPLWYVRDLFVLNLLAPVFEWLVKRLKVIFPVIMVLLWIFIEETGIFCMDIQALCFWGLGCWFAKNKITLSSLDKYKTAIGITYAALAAAEFIMWQNGLKGMGFMAVSRLCMLTGVFFFYVFTTKIKGERFGRIILFVSKYSFCIFLFHEMNLLILRKILTKALPQTPLFSAVLFFVIPFIIIVFCVLISVVLERFMPRVYGVISGGRRTGK